MREAGGGPGAIEVFGGWDAWTDAVMHGHGTQMSTNNIEICQRKSIKTKLTIG